MTKEERIAAQEIRFHNMYGFDRGYDVLGALPCIGIDEAGRGPLAGPVVAAAVMLPADENALVNLKAVNDSKKLSEKKRNELYNLICEHAIAIGVGAADNEMIDEINILNATKNAMAGAIKNLMSELEQDEKKPAGILVDAVNPGGGYDCTPIIKGDEKSLSIAAASIIAKVTRDAMMCEYSLIYPEYGFELHKGYGTQKHYQAIREHGLTPIHRLSFLKSLHDTPLK